MPSLPGVILFPTDLTLPHQFLSVVLMATNSAPEGVVLTIRDLTARIRLPAGLGPARTSPPTTLGTPISMREPGPGGERGTADDLSLLAAQATAQAEFLVEGLRKGAHIVYLDLEGILEGPPTGFRRIEGTARGAVVVRDPTLGVVVSHPDVVRADEEYTMEVSVTNNGVTPANLVSLALPPSQLAGVVVVGDNRRTIDSILPGESDIVEFRLRPLLTGSVIASFVRADNHINPSFDLRVGVGEAGIPLSPTEIVLWGMGVKRIVWLAGPTERLRCIPSATFLDCSARSVSLRRALTVHRRRLDGRALQILCTTQAGRASDLRSRRARQPSPLC